MGVKLPSAFGPHSSSIFIRQSLRPAKTAWAKCWISKIANNCCIALTALAVCMSGCDNHIDNHSRERDLEFSISRATWSSVDLSNDGKSIVISALGDIYEVPIDGGIATAILTDKHINIQPRYSHDGENILFASNRSGVFLGWKVSRSSGEIARLTTNSESEQFTIAESNNGLYAYQTSLHGAGNILVQNANGDLVESIENSKEPTFWNDCLYFSKKQHLDDELSWQIARRCQGFDAEETVLVGKYPLVRPIVSRSGRFVVFGIAKMGRLSLSLLNTNDGSQRILDEDFIKIATNIRANVSPTRMPGAVFSRNDRYLYAISGSGRLYRFDLVSYEKTEIPFSVQVKKRIPRKPHIKAALVGADRSFDVASIRWTQQICDGRAVFGSVGKIWIAGRKGSISQLTPDSEIHYFPEVNIPQGTVAFVDFSGGEHAKLHFTSLGRFSLDRVLVEEAGFLASPAWTSDGMRLAYLKGNRVAWDGPGYRAVELSVMIYDVANGSQKEVASIRLGQDQVRRPEWIPRLEFTTVNGEEYIAVDHHDGFKRALRRFKVADGSEMHGIPSPIQASFVSVSPDSSVTLTIHEASVCTYPAENSRCFDIPNIDHIVWEDSQVAKVSSNGSIWRLDTHSGQQEKVRQISLRLPRIVGGRLAVRGATVFVGPDLRRLERATILVSGRRIEKIGREEEIVVPAEYEVIDAYGSYVIPGLIDSHFHINANRDARRGVYGRQEASLKAALAFGVTTVFDPAEQLSAVNLQNDLVQSGQLVGPRVFGSGYPLLGMIKSYDTLADSQEEAHQLVGARYDQGAVLVKSYAQPTRANREYIVKAAKQAGVGVTAELVWFDLELLSLAAEGHNSIEHMGNSTEISLNEDWATYFARTETNFTTTLSTMLPRSSCTAPAYDVDIEQRVKRLSAVAAYESWKSKSCAVGAIPEEVRFKASNVGEIIKHGGIVSAGSHGDIDGIGLHVEATLLASGGIDVTSILKALTYNGALKLGVERDLGSIGSGKIADMVILHEDPFQDLQNLMRPEYVVRDGVVFAVSQW